jgi:putative hydrolase of the HAD superfamily
VSEPSPSPLPRAVLLDLDDTILDDSGAAVDSWRAAGAAHADLLGGHDVESVLEAIRRVGRWYWSDPERHRIGRLDLDVATRHIVATALRDLGADLPHAAVRIAADYRARRDAAIAPFEDAVATVEWLRARGCRLALLTNGAAAPQRAKVERFDLARLFDVVLIEGEVGFGKPDPRIYERALDALALPAADTWMVGDNLEWDVAQPQRMGVFAVWVDRSGAGVPAGRDVKPDRVIRRLAELRVERSAGSRPASGRTRAEVVASRS